MEDLKTPENHSEINWSFKSSAFFSVSFSGERKFERIERKFKAQKPDLFHIFENSWRKFSFINPYKIGLEIAEVILAK